MSQQRSLTNKASWLFAGKLIAFLLAIVTPLVVARRLDLVTQGVYKQLFAAILSASNILPLGFATCAYYFLPSEKEKRNEIIFNIVIVLSLVGLVGAVLVLAFPQIYTKLLGDPSLSKYAVYVALAIPLTVLCQGFETLLMANQEVQLTAFLLILIQATRTLSIFLAVTIWGTPLSILISFLIQGAIIVTLMFWYLISRFPGFWKHFDGQLLRRQIAYAAPIGLAGLLWILQLDMHNYFVSNFFGAAALAIYQNGCFQLPLMGMIAESSTAVVLPRLSELRKSGTTQEMLNLVARVMRKLSVPAFAIYFYFSTVAEPFMVFLLTNKFRPSALIFSVNLLLILTTIFPADPLMRTFPERRMYFIKFQCFLLPASALMLWWATPKFGPYGAIAVVAAAGIIDRLFAAFTFSRILNVTRADFPQFYDIGRTALSAVVGGAASLAVKHQIMAWQPVETWRTLFILLACTSITFAIVYIFMLFLTGFPDDDEKALLQRFLPISLKAKLV